MLASNEGLSSSCFHKPDLWPPVGQIANYKDSKGDLLREACPACLRPPRSPPALARSPRCLTCPGHPAKLCLRSGCSSSWREGLWVFSFFGEPALLEKLIQGEAKNASCLK